MLSVLCGGVSFRGDTTYSVDIDVITMTAKKEPASMGHLVP